MDTSAIEAFEDKAELASRLLKSIANEKRLLILCHLITGEKSVGELEKLVGLSQSALSQHLARLRRETSFQRDAKRKPSTTLSRVMKRGRLATLYELYCADEPESA